MVEKEAFLVKPKHQCHLSYWVEWVFGTNHEKKGDYYVNPSLSQLRKEVKFQKMVEREVFLAKPNIQCHLS